MTLIRARHGGHGAERSTRWQVTSVQTVTVMIQFTQKQLQLSRWRSWWRGWDDCKIVMTRRIRPGSSSGGGGEQFVSRHPATPLLTTPQQQPGLKIRLCLISGLG